MDRPLSSPSQAKSKQAATVAMLRTVATLLFIVGGIVWFVMIVFGGVLASSPSLSTVSTTTIATVPLIVGVIIRYVAWERTRKQPAARLRIVRRYTMWASIGLLLVPLIISGYLYLSDHIGHTISGDFTFAYRQRDINMDNNSQFYVYTTDMSPSDFVKRTPNTRIIDSTTIGVSIHGTEHTMSYCMQTDETCADRLQYGHPFNRKATTEQFVMTIDDATYHYLRQ